MSMASYLDAKRTVDDRALNRHVFERFSRALPAEPRILEVGAGTGTMVCRLAEWDALHPGTYHAVERDPEHAARARERLPDELASAGYDIVSEQTSNDGAVWELELANGPTVCVEVDDALAVAKRVARTDERFDAIVACAVLDLLPLPDTLETFFDALAPGGVLYAPITFDGLTAFLPGGPDDTSIIDAYHRHMREREGAGPEAGRAVLTASDAIGESILAAGGSDWLIRPHDGGYPAREELVLEHLLSTVIDAVSTMDAPDDATLERWARRRREQLAAAELTLLAHNLDVLIRRPSTD